MGGKGRGRDGEKNKTHRNTETCTPNAHAHTCLCTSTLTHLHTLTHTHSHTYKHTHKSARPCAIIVGKSQSFFTPVSACTNVDPLLFCQAGPKTRVWPTFPEKWVSRHWRPGQRQPEGGPRSTAKSGLSRDCAWQLRNAHASC